MTPAEQIAASCRHEKARLEENLAALEAAHMAGIEVIFQTTLTGGHIDLTPDCITHEKRLIRQYDELIGLYV